MGVTYTKAEISNMVDLIFKYGNLSTLYNQAFVNYVGNTSDTNDAFIEVIADHLLNRRDNFNSYFSHIGVSRKSSYRTMSHDKEWPDIKFNTPKLDDELRKDKIAKCIFIESDWDDEAGKMLDYQLPLKDGTDEDIEKIDLASYSERENVIRLFEVKSEKSEKTVLQAILKLYTFAKMLDFQKLQSDFKIVSNPRLVIVPLVYEESPVVGQMNLPLIKDFVAALDIPVELFTWKYDKKGERKIILEKK